MSNWYIYDEDHKPVRMDMLEACKWLSGERKKIEKTEINGHLISTVFLGLDHSWDESEPILWETMIFSSNSDLDQYQDRYSSYEDALAGHKKAVDLVKSKNIIYPEVKP